MLLVFVGAACEGTFGAEGGDGGPVGGDDRTGPVRDGGDGDSDADADGDADGGLPPPVDPWSVACPWVSDHQYPRPSDVFFEPSVLIDLDLELAPDDWQWLLANPDLEEYRPGALVVCGQRLEGVGLRFKKSTHPAADLPEGYPKNPMVIDLSEFAPGQKLRGLRHVNLEYGGDQMLVAERMNWETLGGFGLQVSRVGSARLRINGEMIGVFTNVERVDRAFADQHFGDDDGNLYKHSYCGTFLWRGSDPDAYLGDPRCYEKKTNELEADYSDLLHVIDVLNNTPSGELEAALPEVLDVDSWIPLMASLQALGYGDTPNANANNFFTYDSATTGRFQIVPWDLDGGFWTDGAPCEHPADPLHWDLFRFASCYDTLPLFQRVVDRSAWRDRYLTAVRDFVDGPFAPAEYERRAREVVTLLAPGLAQDPNRDGNDDEWAASVEELIALQAERAQFVRGQLADEGY